MRVLIASLLLFAACGHHSQPCPQVSCKVGCPGGFVKDDSTGCPSCVCNGLPVLDGGACPALNCNGTCGLGGAIDPTTGCPTCDCCNPADCIDSNACHGVMANGCPTCFTCR
jgi:hypothetical protein